MDIFFWVLNASAYGSALIVLVVGLKLLAGKWMSARWHYAIWLLVFVRLALPAGPEARFSMGNLWAAAGDAEKVPGQPEKSFSGLIDLGLDTQPGANVVVKKSSDIDRFGYWSLQRWLAMAWGAGAMAFLLVLIVQGLQVRRLIRNAKSVDDEATTDLFRECCSLMQIRRGTRLLYSDELDYPALAGVFRPVVLVPSKTLRSVPTQELRFILIHELVHLRRRDLLIAMATAPLLALHWFNPLIWFAWFRMRHDREIACDAEVVRIIGSEVAADYGRTLLKLAEQIAPRRNEMSGAVGIMEGKSETGKRIVMLSNYRVHGRASGWTGAFVALMLMAVGFTSAQEESTDKVDVTTASQAAVMPTVEDIPADLKEQLEKSREAIDAHGAAITTAALSLPKPTLPNGKLLSSNKPFKLTVAEKEGILIYTFAPDTNALESITAEKDVVFSTEQTTITAKRLSYVAATEILKAEGPYLTVSTKGMVYAGDEVVWKIKDDSMTLKGNVSITQKDSLGRVTKTLGDIITVSLAHGRPRARVGNY